MTPPPDLSLDLLLEDWRGARERAAAYLEALGAPREARSQWLRAALERAVEARAHETWRGAIPETLDALAALMLVELPPCDADAAGRDEAFLRWRLERAWGGWPGSGDAPPARSLPDPAPPLDRAPMVPERVGGRRLGQFARRRHGGAADADASPRRGAAWRWTAWLRRAFLLALVLPPSAIAGGFMLDIMPYQGRASLEPLIAILFGALFGWISLGFWTAVFGFFVLLRRRPRISIARDPDEGGAIDPEARTAIVMPVCNERVDRVFAGLRAIRSSLERAGGLAHFDFFVLSDSSEPQTWLAEERGWAEWVRTSPGPGGIYYRRRKVRQKRKSGNVADFCRRWGRRYRYMVVLDADSVMSGETLLRLVRRMERNPTVGILQTIPVVVRARSLFGRVTQFGSRLYGAMFAAGMQFWQLGDAPYWGHNAIVRVAPFMAHCALPRLPGPPPFGGDVLSHDFVEAALLGRAGWSTWLALDMQGSYEEAPDSLLEEMQRDRRWCQGNLQHLRLLLTEGVTAAHRALFLNGIFSYVSALLWLAFLAVSTAEVILRATRPPDYFPTGPSLFPVWPVWKPDWALALLGLTGVLLFGPKLLALVLVLWRRDSVAGFGGVRGLVRSALVEIVASALLAPIRMLFYCRFVLLQLLGRSVTWRGGDRVGNDTTWGEALRQHGVATLLAIAWAGGLAAVDWATVRWVAPIAGALVLSIPLSVLASRESLGRWAARRGWLRVPEESAPPRELTEVALGLLVRGREPAGADGVPATLAWAVVDPLGNALHAALLRRPRRLAPRLRKGRLALLERAVHEGPLSLDAREWRRLLSDPAAMREAHRAVWRLEDRARGARWGLP